MLIRVPRDQRSFDSSPGLIAVFHALHRLLAPRHPPHALSSLAALIQSSVRPKTRAFASGSDLANDKMHPATVPPPWVVSGISNDPFLSQAHAENSTSDELVGLRLPTP